MAYIKAMLNDNQRATLEKRAAEEGVSPSTMLAFILDRGDNHLCAGSGASENFLRQGDKHLAEGTTEGAEAR